MNKNIKLSMIASSILAATVFSGCYGESKPSSFTTDLSGTAVDGYISGANVNYDGKTAKTDANGKWTIVKVPNKDFGNNTKKIEVSGGTDMATGEAFEGTLKAVIPAKKGGSTVVTPLTTLVAAAVTSSDSIDSVKKQIANGLGLDVATLDMDPVANIDKPESKKALKAILQVQKIVEALSKTDTADKTISDKAFASIATSLKADTKDTDGAKLDTALTTTIKSVTTDANTIEALTVVKETLKNIDETKLTNVTELKTVSKAVEVVTAAVEKNIEENKTEEAAKTAKALSSSFDEILDDVEDEKVDASDYNTSSLVTDEKAVAYDYQDFSLAGVDTNITREGQVAPITVSTGFDNTLTASYANFAERVDGNTSGATFAMRITQDEKEVLIKVTNTNITKSSDTSANIVVGTDSALNIAYTNTSGVTKNANSTNITADTFTTDANGAMTVDLTSQVNTIRANSAYSDFNDTISEWFNKQGTYTVQSCLSTNVTLKDGNAFTKVISIDGTDMNCVEGNVTVQ